MGILYVVGFGSGSREQITPEADQAIKSSDLIVGYETYTRLISGIYPDKHCISTAMRGEVKRADTAIREALKGRTVSVICSGDPVVYGMAGLILERYEIIRAAGCGEMDAGVSGSTAAGKDEKIGEKKAGNAAVADAAPGTAPGKESMGFVKSYDIEIIIVPGITAALFAGALLGAPLTSDFAVISLSDLITPREKIEKRLRAAAAGDFSMAIYNPSSKTRRGHLGWACGILLEYLPPETVCGYVRNAGRDGQEKGILPLKELLCFEADMFTTIFVGNSETRVIGGRMVTPRGYKHE